MNDEQRELEEKRLIEEAGLLAEQYGLPRMAGRVLGWLLISDPPQQSTKELAQALMASKGSISTMTRLLIQLGLVERVTRPGVRHDYFCIKPDTWQELIKQMFIRMTRLREFSDRGMKVLEGRPARLRDRLEALRELGIFVEQQLPEIIDRWEERHMQGTN